MPLTTRERRIVSGLNVAELILLVVALIFSISIVIVNSAGNNLENSVLWTACSMTFAHCEIKVIYNDTMNIFAVINGITGEAVLLVVLWTFVEHLLYIDLRAINMKRKAYSMKNHFIICGYGRVGEQVCNVLIRAKKDFVVIDKSKERCQILRDAGYIALEGDAMNPKILESAGVGKAKGLVAALSTDADNIFVVLTATELNPDLTIAARAHSESVVSKLQKAGTEIIVLPEVSGGLELGREILKLGGTVTYKFLHEAGKRKKKKK